MKKLLGALLSMALATFMSTVSAVFDPVNDDTDIFLANPTFNVQRPNVLIIVDNTANWNQPFAAEKTALVNAVNSLGDQYNVGLMMFTETGSGNGTPDGGYVKYAVRQMTTANKAVLTSMVTSLHSTNDMSNGGKTSLAMYEAFQYFGGATAYAGANKIKRDFAGNASNPAASLAGNAFSSAGETTYTSPIVDGCQKNFIIYISNGPAQDNTSDLTVSEAKLKALNNNNNPTVISLNPNGSEGNWADEWARYMSSGDCNFNIAGTQNIITYTLDVGPSETVDGGQGGGWTALLKSMATNGKGKYFAIQNSAADTASQIEAALKTIFSEVQAVNSVFASTTLPVSVNVRGTNLNQVYIGVFRPEPDKQPRWFGNLKMYKLAVDTATGTVFLADALNAKAENASTGFISNTATSFWTSNSCFFKYYAADPDDSVTTVPATCDSATNSYPYWSDKPDGDDVERGGAAQRIRETYPAGQGSRKIYTCTSASGGICATNALLSATPFSAGGTGYPADNTNILAADLGAYLTYAASSASSAGTTATVTLPSTPSPAFANGNTVRIEGATPGSFNGDYAIGGVTTVGSGISFTYTLAAALPSNVAVVTTSSAHNLGTSDLIQATGGVPAEYNTSGDVAITTRLSATQFTYNLSANAATGATTLPTIKGKKTASAISGSGTSATATITAHGFTSASVTNFSITGACAPAFNVTNVTATVVNANTVTFSTGATTIPGTLCGTPTGVQGAVRVTTPSPHELLVGDTITVTGLTPTEYNVTNGTITAVPGTTTFEYIPATTPSSSASGTASITATRAFTLGNSGSSSTSGGINNGSGSTKDNAFGRTPSTHGVSATNWTVVIAGVDNDTDFNKSTAVTFTIPSTNTSTGFTYTVSNVNNSTTASASTGAITATFRRNAISVTGNATNFSQIISDTTAGMQAVLTVTPSTVAVQSSATGIITAGRPIDDDATLRTRIINWARGADNLEDENVSGSTSTSTDVRASAHGDVLHSRPAVVNYNRFDPVAPATSNDNDIYAFYGSNDGMVHALKGGLASDESGVNAGDERWAFMPREFFPKLKRLRDNLPLISSSNPRSYLGDGPVSVYTQDVNADTKLKSADGDKVHLFFAVRRGGRFLYALDVSDPAAPKFLWRKNNSSTGYAELGQTWSEPKVSTIKIKLDPSDVSSVAVDKTVLIFGGGYDPIDDLNPCLLDEVSSTGVVVKAIGTGTVEFTSGGSCVINNATGTTSTRTRAQGRAIFVVDAGTGDVLWHAGPSPAGATLANGNKTVSAMTCAIPSDITLIDVDREGHVDRGYVGDMCGNVWRFDISDQNVANWTVAQIGAVSSTTATDVPNQRKFLFPPDVVFSKDSVGAYAAILLGSGDREHPFATNVADRFYMFKDRTASGGGFTSQASCTTANTAGNPITDAKLFDATNTAGNNECGFKLTFNAGEKNVGSAVTLAGTTFFNTNQPSSTAGGGACGSNLGIARQYLIDFEDASATIDLNATGSLGLDNRSVIHTGGGFLPSPVPAVVELDGKKYEIVISGTAVQQPAGTTLDTRARTYWYKEFE